MSNPHVSNKSFTLIELLVVIAIIGLLASIVLVSIGGLQSKAKITKTIEFSQNLQRALGAYAVGIWGFDEGSGATAIDASGYGNNGAIKGVVAYTEDTPHSAAGIGTGRYALSFNGTNNYIKVSAAKGLPTSNITLEAWFYVLNLVDWRLIIDHEKDSNGGWELNINGSGNANFTIKFNNNRYTSSKSGVSTNKWYHIVGVYDGTNLKTYINAQKGTDGALSSASLDSAGDVYIGADDYLGNLFSGYIDEVRVYETALSLGEIQQHYVQGLGRHQGFVIK